MLPTTFQPGQTRPIGEFADLPANIRKKIVIQDDGCWHWTGTVTAARTRPKMYRVPKDYEGTRNFSGSYQRERGAPQVRHPGKGWSVSAWRYIYGLLTGLDYGDVPTLSRCGCDTCVSPHHVVEMDVPPQQKLAQARARDAEGFYSSEKAQPETAQAERQAGLQEDVLDKLKECRPTNWGGVDIAEEEYGFERGSISIETWDAYVSWTVENPEED
ncbi:hypothetical protein [Methylobacterium sp. SyP6R]|uniref:hypothetical protein n=1 Tax=Methylobacterium sp. SyP6R TaxID=2718876 RepID=UPI001F3185CF|nr:hypothetical protein [Methylobacterium sp. SyP6R]MCF4125194.1 hypothetical protein [Methylobacterium sp. SyP6R]